MGSVARRARLGWGAGVGPIGPRAAARLPRNHAATGPWAVRLDLPGFEVPPGEQGPPQDLIHPWFWGGSGSLRSVRGSSCAFLFCLAFGLGTRRGRVLRLLCRRASIAALEVTAVVFVDGASFDLVVRE